MAPFKEKPITRRGDPSSVLTFTPWTNTELGAVAKEFPDPSQDHWDFLRIRINHPGLQTWAFRSISTNTAISFCK